MNFGVGHRGEMVIPEADGVEGAGLHGADQFIDSAGEQGAGFGCADGNGDGDVGGMKFLQGEDGDAQAVAGGDAVVDEDDVAVCEIERWAVAAVERFAALELGGFAFDRLVDDLMSDAFGGDEGVVEELDAAGGECADGELGVGGMADFAHEKNVERNVERAGDLGADGHAAARQREHEGVLAGLRGEVPCERLAGFAAVAVAIDRCHGEASVTGGTLFRCAHAAMGENTKWCDERAVVANGHGESPIGGALIGPISGGPESHRLRR